MGGDGGVDPVADRRADIHHMVGEGDGPRDDGLLITVLEESRDLGFLGTGPVEDHIRHARAMIRAVPRDRRFFIDLGSGGGVPGLVLVADRPELRGALLDGSTRRGAFLQTAVVALGRSSDVDVLVQRAEDVGRTPEHRMIADVALARSFGPPAVVAECAAPLLQVGGLLIVSDPPSITDPPTRWPESGLAPFGLRVVGHEAGPPAFTVLEQWEPCPERFPRRVGIPTKRPLF